MKVIINVIDKPAVERLQDIDTDFTIYYNDDGMICVNEQYFEVPKTRITKELIKALEAAMNIMKARTERGGE